MASKLICTMKHFRPLTSKLFSSRLQSSMPLPISALEQALNDAPQTTQGAIANGLRVASENTGGDTCTVGVWIDAGARFESEANNGITHFLEHTIFKGTENRSQMQLEAEVENMGAHLNAYTSIEQTAYYAKCLKKDLPAVVNILADVIQNPLLEDETIETARNSILKEMAEVDSNLEEVVFDHLHATAYQGTPLANSVLGPTANVESFTKADLQSYVKTHFNTPRMVLAASGGVDHDTLFRLAEENFGGLPTATYKEAYSMLKPCRYTGSEVRDRNDFLPLAHVAMAVESCGWSNPDYFTLMVAQMITGSFSRSMGAAANVFGKMVQNTYNHHAAESFNSFNMTYTDTGLFGVHMVCDRMVIPEMMYLVQRRWMDLCTGITDADVHRAKLALKTNLLLQVDGTTGSCEDIGRQILAYGRRISLLELNERIDAIDANKVREISDKYIYDTCPVVAGAGPIEAMTDYSHVRGSMYWLRL